MYGLGINHETKFYKNNTSQRRKTSEPINKHLTLGKLPIKSCHK